MVKDNIAFTILAVTQEGNVLHVTIHGCTKCYMKISEQAISDMCYMVWHMALFHAAHTTLDFLMGTTSNL